LVEPAPAEQLGAHRPEVTGRDAAVIGQQALLLIFTQAFGRVGAVPVRVVVERQVRDRARRLDAGQRDKLLLPPRDEGGALRGVRVLRAAEADFKRQHAVGPEAGVNLLQPRERAEQQARADEQHEAQRDLARDEQRPRATAAVRDAAPGLLQRRDEVDAARAERRGERREQPGEQRDRRREARLPQPQPRAVAQVVAQVPPHRQHRSIPLRDLCSLCSSAVNCLGTISTKMH
jgi:hypothetical protein